MILPVRPMHDDRPHQPQRIDGQVPLAAGDLFARIVAPFFASFGRADRLAVDDRRRGRAPLADAAPHSPAQGVVNSFPEPIDSANAETRCRRSSTWESRAAIAATGSRCERRTGSHR